MNETRKAVLKKHRKNRTRKKRARQFRSLVSYSVIKKLAFAGDEGARDVLRASRHNGYSNNVRLFEEFVGRKKR